ncbi:angiogenic factor with G patch and FHA domains 1 [Bacillus rossius redtenbacheri]|uniref:angiogenic factor with G patch and FHA domains 1 n=1 Tax=Bacillus rossius redtenbacheri TaxID=93214 RepID=UPI002FDCC3FC
MECESNEHDLNDKIDYIDDDITVCSQCKFCKNENFVEDDLISGTIPITFHAELQAHPKLFLFIKRLQCCIRKQRHSLKKIYGHVPSEAIVPDFHDAATQTEDFPNSQIDASTQSDVCEPVDTGGEALQSQVVPNAESTAPAENFSWTSSCIDVGKIAHTNLADEVKQAAESAMQQTGFVYEATSGMYYDYSTGYYYDAERGLYYNGDSGTYYSFDSSTNEFKFHSQAAATYPLSQVSALTSPQEIPLKTKRVKQKENTKEKKRLKVMAENSGDGEPREDMDVSLEEGECSESSASSSCSDNDDDAPSDKDDMLAQDDELAAAWPPCIRIIVTETGLEKLKVGTLFIVTYTGGTLGREGDHAVLIPDINISKVTS